MITYTKDGILVNEQFISLKDITEKCNIEKIKSENINLLKIEWPSHRGFNAIYEIVALPLNIIHEIKKLVIGNTVYFGEIAGKHSEVYGTIDETDTKIVNNTDEILEFLKSNPDGHKYNYSFLLSFMNNSIEEISESEMRKFKEIYNKFIK